MDVGKVLDFGFRSEVIECRESDESESVDRLLGSEFVAAGVLVS